jgi:hypothetical protein
MLGNTFHRTLMTNAEFDGTSTGKRARTRASVPVLDGDHWTTALLSFVNRSGEPGFGAFREVAAEVPDSTAGNHLSTVVRLVILAASAAVAYLLLSAGAAHADDKPVVPGLTEVIDRTAPDVTRGLPTATSDYRRSDHRPDTQAQVSGTADLSPAGRAARHRSSPSGRHGVTVVSRPRHGTGRDHRRIEPCGAASPWRGRRETVPGIRLGRRGSRRTGTARRSGAGQHLWNLLLDPEVAHGSLFCGLGRVAADHDPAGRLGRLLRCRLARC